MTPLKPIIAIDGPAGSGKSTVAKLVAKKLGLFYIDTGAMYRALALKAKRAGVSPHDEEAVAGLAETLQPELRYDAASDKLVVILDGEDISEEIRKPYITADVSYIAKIKKVRDRMVGLQRKLAEGKKSILEGRDIGTTVFPDAYKKFYLDAAPEERVRRRYLEMKGKNIPIDETNVKNDIESRDRIDSTREHAPLRRSADACYIDTTELSIDQVVERIIEETRKS